MPMQPKVYITRRIPESALRRIREMCQAEMWDEEDVAVPRSVLEKKIADIDGLYCMLTERIDEPLLARARNLKVISTMAVGYNHIDVKAARKRGIRVCNTPGVLTETTADLAFALLMAAARRLIEASDFLRQGKWNTWAPMLLTGVDVYGATLGIIGLGRIGEAIARRARGFDMRVLYHSRSRKPEAEERLGGAYVDLDTLLRESDFVCIMTPYTPETHRLIGERELALMKPTAVLINAARGGIVDERALYEALKNGIIRAAGLDVFEKEPVDPDHPLLTLPNVVALPHIGSASVATRVRMAELAADNLLKVLAGEDPPCEVLE